MVYYRIIIETQGGRRCSGEEGLGGFGENVKNELNLLKPVITRE